MLKLIRLEMKKYKIGTYIRGAIIANLVMMGLPFIIFLTSKTTGENAFQSYDEIFLLINLLVKATFIVFASVLLSRFVLEEYKSGTITLLFMYPIKRKKLFAAKLLIVSSFTFLSIIVTNIFLIIVSCTINSIDPVITEKLTEAVIFDNLLMIGTSALTSCCMALIPLFIGMKSKSVPATIISSIVIASIVCQTNSSGFSLSSIVAIPIVLSVIGVLIAYLSIRNIEHIDVKL